jgi:hypothetical protein
VPDDPSNDPRFFSFVWTVAKESVVGISTNDKMLEALEEPTKEKNLGSWDGSSGTEWLMDLAELPRQETASGFRPIQTPLMVSGMDQEVLTHMGPLLASFGMTAVPGGRTSSANGPGELEPGSAVGVVLVDGDISAAAVGTLTYIDGDKLLAFGHPMFHAGSAEYPLAPAMVASLIPLQSVSFKVSNIGDPVGTILQDRQLAVGGVVGRVPEMLGLTIDIKPSGSAILESYDLRVIKEQPFAASFVGYAVANAIRSIEKSTGPVSAEIITSVLLSGGRRVTREDFFHSTTPVGSIYSRVTMPLWEMVYNPFEDVEIESVRVTLDVAETIEIAWLDKIVVKDEEVGPGEKINVLAFIRPFRQEGYWKSIDLDVPENLPEGELILTVEDANSAWRSERDRAPGRFEPTSLDQLISLLEEEKPRDTMVIRLIARAPGFSIEGRELPRRPGSMKLVMDSGMTSGVSSETYGKVVAQRLVPIGYMLQGSHVVELTVERDIPR